MSTASCFVISIGRTNQSTTNMKHLRILPILLVFGLSSTPAAAQLAVVTVDMETMEMTTPAKCLKLDYSAVITLLNVNPLTTSVTITSKNVKVYTEQNTTTRLLTGFPDSKAGEALGEAADQDAPAASTDETEEKIDELEKQRAAVESAKTVELDRNKKMVGAISATKAMKGIDLQAKINEFGFADQAQLDTLEESELKRFLSTTLERDLEASNDLLVKYNVQAGKLDADIAQLKTELKALQADPYLDAYKELQDHATAVYIGWKYLQALGAQFKVLETTMKDPCLSVAEIMARVEKCGEEFMDECFNGEELILGTALQQFERAYEQFLLEPGVSKRLKDDQEEKGRVTGLKNAVAAVKTDFAKNDYAAIIANYHALYNSMRSGAAYTIHSLPVQAEEDYIEFEVKVEAKQGVSGACSPTAGTFTYKLYICGGVKVDFGTGPVALFGLEDESYRLETDPGNADNSIVSKDPNNQDLQPALMATIHISPRTACKIKPDLMLGAGIDMNKFENITLAIGPGIMFGRDPWVAIHGGLVAKPVQVLKGDIEQDRSYATTDLDPTELTEAKYKVGWFVGVSFLFPKKKD